MQEICFKIHSIKVNVTQNRQRNYGEGVTAKRIHILMAEFILETFCRSKRIIPKTDNSSKCKSEDEFCSIICLDILSGNRKREKGNITKI